jgi:ParB family chromosome partitioning protein
VEAPEVVLIPTEIIRPNENQPRSSFDEEALKELAESIRVSGVLQPILVRPVRDSDEREYELVAGERRLRAGKLAGLVEIPAMIRDMSDEESLAVALIENLQREDLNPIEEAKGLAQLQQRFELNQETLAERVGKSRPAIANALRLLHLPDQMQEAIRSGRLSAGHGRALLAVDDENARGRLSELILEKGMSVREAEAAATYYKRTGSLPGESAAKKSRGRRKQELPKELVAMQRRLNENLGCKVSFKGDVESGRIVLEYSDRGQLEKLVATLGLDAVNVAGDTEA